MKETSKTAEKVPITIYLNNKYTLAIIFSRLLGYAVIPFYPLEGMVLSLILDYTDWIIMTVSDLPKRLYHRLDKIIDYIQYLVILIPLWNTPILHLYLIFLAWRTAGHIIFEKTQNKKVFFIFPNVAEYIALIYFVSIRFSLNIDVVSPTIITAIIVLKLVVEYLLHFKSTGISYDIMHKLLKRKT